ncbi:hypothetical protein PV327_006246 [Microctonus hyperodae]|uniref:Serine/threonine-protein phosphatase 4 regulatory subunit 2 n=1 Tax=Microctonus hyperodae TaxID=165561 RepID=A0AA39F3X2_MICHY|nr:hypothetical protein PV327_006246 [Microctonus hyperodae]
MDNPEEVLQALDEFQKVRPSEIPRELEDYLNFVAKTGDPVYQWSLIKPLFREKLVRVMTDFYETCPTLDLASSPNLEHFNYDIMKCNLLELLESFANAPFTVQRICELLTSPRKEYNRVDKFMRAIEKNILVVSTKEPGPAARRNENGDSMVNGTIDDDESTPTAQTTNEVEMESWVKDCTTDTNVSPIVSEHDVSLMVTAASGSSAVIPTKITKDLLSDDDNNTSSVIHGRNELQSKSSEMTVSNFIAAAHEISNATNIVSAISTSNITSNNSVVNDTSLMCDNNVENSSANITDDTHDNSSSIGIAIGDVAEAIVNEDTSSQPSLDSESGDDSESNVTITAANANENNKKLQTTFQTKDFVKIDDNKMVNNKYYCDSESQIDECKLPLLSSSSSSSSSESSPLINNESDINFDGEGRSSPARQRDGTASNSDDESKSSCDSNSESIEKRPRIECDNDTAVSEIISDKIDNGGNNFASVIATKIELNSSVDELRNDNDKLLISNDELIIDETKKIDGGLSRDLLTQSEIYSTNQEQVRSELSSDSVIHSGNSKENESEELIGDTLSKVIVEEPNVDRITECLEKNSRKCEDHSSVVIEEAMDDDIKETNSNTMIPHPIPIVEEPKDDDINTENNSTVISELSTNNISINDNRNELLQRDNNEDVCQSSIDNLQANDEAKIITDVAVNDELTSRNILISEKSHELNPPDIVEQMESKTIIDAGESMEIDNEETMAVPFSILINSLYVPFSITRPRSTTAMRSAFLIVLNR